MINHWAATLNIIKTGILQKKRYAFIPVCKKNTELLKKLYSLGVINAISFNDNKIRVLLNYQQNNTSFFNFIYIKKKTISFKTLKNIKQQCGSFFIISSTKNIKTDNELIYYKLGGKIICELFC